MRQRSGGLDTSIVDTRASWTLIGDVARDRLNQVIFVVTAAAITFAYSMLLTFAYTQRFSWANWHYLSTRLLVWSMVLALSMASVVVLQVYALRKVSAARPRTGVLGGLAFLGSVVPSLLCCTPIIPTTLAFVGFSSLSVYGTTGSLQHFFATYQTQFFVGSFLLIALSAWWSVHRITIASCVSNGCDIDPNEGARSTSVSLKAIAGESQ